MPEPISEPKRIELAPPSIEAPTPPQPERIDVSREQPEAAPAREKKDDEAEGAIESVKRTLGRQKKTRVVPTVRDAMTIRVEKIMEEGLADAYKALPAVKREEFKLAGERTAYAIRQLMDKTHVKIKKIFKLLFAWLKLLPGVNRYFLEQEAKIKADKIFALKYRR